MKEKTTTTTPSVNGGIGFCGALTIAFVVLKLTNYINWSWWWITAPMWGPLAFVTAIAILIAVVVLIIAIFNKS